MEYSYLETPAFLTTILHVCTCFEVPIHLLGAWCILFRTPDSMTSVKWTMFNLHFWSAISDLSVSLLTIPFVLVPTPSGFPMGVFQDIGVPLNVQTNVMFVLLATTGSSIVTLFENRYFLLFGSKNRWRYFRIPFLASNYFCSTFCYLPFFLTVPEQTSALETVYKKLPGLPAFIHNAPMIVVATDTKFVLPFLTIYPLVFPAQSLVFIWFINRGMRNMQHTTRLSKQSFKLQKKFLRAIYIQIAVPVTMISVPIFYFAMSILFEIYNQTANNIAIIIFATHGLFSTTIMLFIHRPYRKACLRIVDCKHTSPKLKPTNFLVELIPNVFNIQKPA